MALTVSLGDVAPLLRLTTHNVKCLVCYVVIGVNEISVHQNGKRHRRKVQDWDFKFPVYVLTGKTSVPRRWRLKRKLEEDEMEESELNYYSNSSIKIEEIESEDDVEEMVKMFKRSKVSETVPTEHYSSLEGGALFSCLENRYQEEISEVVSEMERVFI